MTDGCVTLNRTAIGMLLDQVLRDTKWCFTCVPQSSRAVVQYEHGGMSTLACLKHFEEALAHGRVSGSSPVKQPEYIDLLIRLIPELGKLPVLSTPDDRAPRTTGCAECGAPTPVPASGGAPFCERCRPGVRDKGSLAVNVMPSEYAQILAELDERRAAERVGGPTGVRVGPAPVRLSNVLAALDAVAQATGVRLRNPSISAIAPTGSLGADPGHKTCVGCGAPIAGNFAIGSPLCPRCFDERARAT